MFIFFSSKVTIITEKLDKMKIVSHLSKQKINYVIYFDRIILYFLMVHI